MQTIYPNRLLPNFYKKRLENVLFAIGLMLTLVCVYFAMLMIDELVGFALLGVAMSMLCGWRRPMKFRSWHYLIFALTAILLIAGFVNIGYGNNLAGYGEKYLEKTGGVTDFFYNFLDQIMFPKGQLYRHVPGGYGFGNTIATCTMWWMVIALSARRYTKEEIRTFQNYYNYFITFMSILIVASNQTQNYITNRFSEVSILRIAMLNANTLVYFAVPVIVVSVARLLVKWRTQDLSIALVNTWMIIVCGTRGAMLALAAACVALVIYFLMITPYRKKMLIVLGVILGDILLFVICALAAAPDKTAELFAKIFRLNSLTSNRATMWADGMERMTSVLNWLFGRGFGEFYLFDGRSPSHVGMHNLYLEYFYSAGLIASLTVFAVWAWYFILTHDWFVVAMMASPIMHTLVENGDIPVGFCVMALMVSFNGMMKENPSASRYYMYYFLDEERQAVLQAWAKPIKNRFARYSVTHAN